MDETQRRMAAGASIVAFLVFGIVAAAGHPLFPEVPAAVSIGVCVLGAAWSLWLLLRRPQLYDSAKAAARDEAIGNAIELGSVALAVLVLLALGGLGAWWWCWATMA